jgi:hypothetical protein
VRPLFAPALSVLPPTDISYSLWFNAPTLRLTIVTTNLETAAMQLNILAPIQALSRPKNQFALFFVAFFVAKLLHLGSHFASLPIVLYFLYTPTFLLPDILLLVGSKVLVYRHNGGQSSATRKFFGGILA